MITTEINALTLDDKFFDVLNRLVDFSIITNKKPQYEINPDNKLPIFDRVKLNAQLTAPTLVEMEAELVILKNELVTSEKARLAEIKRIKALELRISKIKDFHQLLPIAKLPHLANGALELNRIVQENDLIMLKKLEAANIVHKANLLNQSRLDKLNKLREMRDSKLTEVDHLINDLILGVRTDKKAILTYQTELKTITDQFKTGKKLKASLDTLDLAKFIWPNKPL